MQFLMFCHGGKIQGQSKKRFINQIFYFSKEKLNKIEKNYTKIIINIINFDGFFRVVFRNRTLFLV